MVDAFSISNIIMIINDYYVSKVRLLEIQKDISDYVTYVFVNLEAISQRDLYIMCTKFPNWESKPLSKNDVGYLKYKENLAGVSMWKTVVDNEVVSGHFKYDSIQFINFVHEKPLIEYEGIVL